MSKQLRGAGRDLCEGRLGDPPLPCSPRTWVRVRDPASKRPMFRLGCCIRILSHGQRSTTEREQAARGRVAQGEAFLRSWRVLTECPAGSRPSQALLPFKRLCAPPSVGGGSADQSILVAEARRFGSLDRTTPAMVDAAIHGLMESPGVVPDEIAANACSAVMVAG